jgi:hypothetical protein
MLVTFRCSSVPSITMFGEHATTLLKLMGQSGVTPGGLAAADIPAAAKRLRDALGSGRGTDPAPAPSRAAADREEEKAGISLGARALPLLDFLERAAGNGDDVTWT